MTYPKWLPALVLILTFATPAAASDKTWSDAGTVGTAFLVGAATGGPLLLHDDWDGSGQGAMSVGAAALVATGLKAIIPEDRPDFSDRHGFPSGHSAVAFAAAASIHNRYGWEVGIPAQALAAFVAVSRVEARKHRWHDVAVGALIGEVSGFLLTERENSRIKLFPWAESKGGGLVMAVRF